MNVTIDYNQIITTSLCEKDLTLSHMILDMEPEMMYTVLEQNNYCTNIKNAEYMIKGRLCVNILYRSKRTISGRKWIVLKCIGFHTICVTTIDCGEKRSWLRTGEDSKNDCLYLVVILLWGYEQSHTMSYIQYSLDNCCVMWLCDVVH